MSHDMLMFGMSQSEKVQWLMEWRVNTTELHTFLPDPHRLQVEHWIWLNKAALGHDVLDVGVDTPRRWVGPGYKTFGFGNEDVKGNLLRMPFSDASFDSVLLTEVLEHCENPPLAVTEVHRVLRPDGLLLATSPFFWPDHRTESYPDFWRFTEQAWELLLRPFTAVTIRAIEWSDEGASAYDLMRRFEAMGFRHETKAVTGYMCEARK